MKTVGPPEIAGLIDRQVRMWDVRQQLAAEGGEAARRELVHLKEGPWLTVSRQLGSGGSELATRLADALGWQLYDREILTTIAEHTHLRERVLSQLDETSVNWLSEYLSHLFTPRSLSQAAFARELTQVVWALGRHGRAVLVGRGGNWVLDPEFGLRLRVVAPLEFRIEAVARQQDFGADEAQREVRARDEQNRTFIRKTFKQDIDDPLGYDLVLNMARMSVATAAEAAQTALRHKLQSRR